MIKPQKEIQATFEFICIAGLVKGSSQGEGLGNQFLEKIREVDVLCQVIGCFEDDNIIHDEGKIDSLDVYKTINLELILSDLEQVEKKISKI